MMNLDETQKATVREWIQSRTGLSEIQSKLDSEFGVSVTYMEVRFLVDDLGGLPAEPEPEPEETPEAVEGDSPAGDPEIPAAAPEPSAAEGQEGLGGPKSNVSVTVDQITRAGSMASGQVTFSDGKSAGWSLDQMGRLGLSSDEAGYKPSQEDVMEFQVQLQKKLSGPGL
ncbi:hypothetical protein N8766_06255 [bacterium]|jgi:hypothetical protein|nr:hypothetical protein [bacterium]